VMPSFPTGWDPAMRQHWKWPGDRVEKDEVVCEIQTDVARVQIPSPAAGILEEWLYRPNEFIYVDGKWGEQVIAKIRTAEQEVAAIQSHSSRSNKSKKLQKFTHTRVIQKERANWRLQVI